MALLHGASTRPNVERTAFRPIMAVATNDQSLWELLELDKNEWACRPVNEAIIRKALETSGDKVFRPRPDGRLNSVTNADGTPYTVHFQLTDKQPVKAYITAPAATSRTSCKSKQSKWSSWEWHHGAIGRRTRRRACPFPNQMVSGGLPLTSGNSTKR